MSIKQDIIERFFNFESFKGVYLLPCGLAGLFFTYINHGDVGMVFSKIMELGPYAFFGYLVAEGLRKIFVNRVKQAKKKEALLRQRDAE